MYQLENFAAETHLESGGCFVRADLIDEEMKFYRRARVAHCTCLESAIQYARKKNLEVSVIQASALYQLIRENCG